MFVCQSVCFGLRGCSLNPASTPVADDTFVIAECTLYGCIHRDLTYIYLQFIILLNQPLFYCNAYSRNIPGISNGWVFVLRNNQMRGPWVFHDIGVLPNSGKFCKTWMTTSISRKAQIKSWINYNNEIFLSIFIFLNV